LFNAADRQVLPAAERLLADLRPEWAIGERLAAPTCLIELDSAVPKVYELAGRTDPVELTDHPFEKGAAAATETSQVKDGVRHVYV
jgi:hypothetical protein